MKKGKVYMSMETVNGTYGSEEQKIEEMTRYLNGLKRYTEKGIPIYMDGKLSGQREWEKLFEVREDGMFYMGDYVQAEGGGLKEIRFDKVYLSEADISETRNSGRRRRTRREKKCCRSQMEKLPVPGEDPGQAQITEYRFKKQGIVLPDGP